MARTTGRQHEEGLSMLRSEDTNTDSQDATQSVQKGPRKRTKTGCLTCRKRRIKCGEEKPTCSNCIKSKRFCEGYHSRVGLRQPGTGWGHTGDAFNARAPVLSNFVPFDGHPSALRRLNTGTLNQTLRPIAPTPLQQHQQNSHAAGDPSYVASSSPFTPAPGPPRSLVNPSGVPFSASSSRTFQSGPQGLSADDTSYVPGGSTQLHASISGPYPGRRHWSDAGSAEHEQNRPSVSASHTTTSYIPTVMESASRVPGEVPVPFTAAKYAPGLSMSSYTNDGTPLTSTQVAAVDGQPLPPDHPFSSQMKEQIYNSVAQTQLNAHDPRRYSSQGFVQRPSFNLSIPSTIESPPMASATKTDYEDDEDEDDPWDVDMEFDQVDIEPSEQSRQDLNNMLIMHASHDARRPTRSYTTFLNEKNILATYKPSHTALPQADEKAARIFCHFVSSTGPNLTIFERPATQQHPNPGVAAISGYQNPLWAYTMPSLALHHPPLMHAMLALAALHISKLQQTSPGPSIKHFTYALRRVGRLIGLPKRRNEVTTLAANLLLGFYEVMSAETSKWNIHLSGARVLVMEIDFAGKTRKIRALRAQLKSQLGQLDPKDYSNYINLVGIPESLLPDRDWAIDEELISIFTGYHVQYDYHYQTNIAQTTHENLVFTAKDVELYKMQADLHWWFCKQDVFQSMISGNRLLMPYDHWVFCPPRGQLGHLDLIYATMDHLCLILARLADFGGKDQVRKRRTMAAKNAQTAQSSAHKGTFAGPPSGQGVPMGYMPSPENCIPMHSAFTTMSANINNTAFSQTMFSTIPPQTPDAQNLEAETTAALAEHSTISHALDVFERSLPAEFDPLPPDAAPPISTPFGPALQYRTHTISCIWAFFYSGRILLHRLHPHMPAAAMISAQVAAAQTATYAQRIGKICAGLYYPQQYNLQTGSLNPSLGGALIESTFSLFFAAIQFQDHAQRGWTINKLKEIARLSGWQTAAAVAAGCEFAWEATGKAGRGPSYTRTMDWRNKDERVGDKPMKRRMRGTKVDQQQELWEREAEREAERERERQQGIGREKEQQQQQQQQQQGKGIRTSSQQDERYFVASGQDGPHHSDRSYRLSRAAGEMGGIEAVPRSGQQPAQTIMPDEGEVDDEEAEPEAITHDRKTIGTNPYARAHWALGLLSLNEDIAKIDLGK